VRGGWLPPLPAPVPWNGWYQAIEDLLPDLEDDEFAPWQLARMPRELLETILLSQGSFDHTDEGNNREAQPIGRRKGSEPAYTVTANRSMLGMRAFLVTGQYAQPNTVPERRCQTKNDDEPSPTVTASAKGDWRAFIADGANCHGDDRLITTREDGEPMFTVSAQSLTKNPLTAAIPGRVVKMSPRCLARFQSIPDSYVLPDNDALAVRIIGNAVPPLLTRQLLEPFA
jgi:DNA (cytosine-5)-methyltransferase 1